MFSISHCVNILLSVLFNILFPFKSFLFSGLKSDFVFWPVKLMLVSAFQKSLVWQASAAKFRFPALPL